MRKLLEELGEAGNDLKREKEARKREQQERKFRGKY